ncbi:hypothetical protein HPB47_023957 [Ixodes persulcatus]|uniref:Uncharacterized protein n=1 Tax=Ixodes persulcatus TaxID=34615 RepID=A0AC60Q648_IXOPE|nr:hypothetical protein HPB47_023957 [Ixodes persulcatus]
MDDVSTRMGPGPEFCDLPCELQLLVLSYLSHGELVLVARVSKALRRLAYDPCLWRTVTVREDMDDRWLWGALDRLSQLEALTLRRSPLVTAWAAHAARFPKLRLLDVGCSLDVNGAALSHFVDGCPLLSHLNVEGCKGVDDAAVEALCQLAGLVSVNMSHCCQVTDDGLLALARGCPRLVSLNVDGISRITDRKKESTVSFLLPGYSSCYYCKLQIRLALDPNCNGTESSSSVAHQLIVPPETAAHSVRDWLPSLPPCRAVCGLAKHLGHQLVCLELDGELLTDASFGALRHCSRLETLFVGQLKLLPALLTLRVTMVTTVHASIQLFTAGKMGGQSRMWNTAESASERRGPHAQELRTLRRLKLRACFQLTTCGLGSLFRGGSLNRLIYLELDMELDDQALALLVKGCPLLQVLSLPLYGDITEVGLATIVNNCPNLESLVLPGPYEVQRLCLAGLPVNMPKLRHLHLDLIEMVDDPFLESLTRRLPHLRVYNSRGQLLVPLCESSGTPSLDLKYKTVRAFGVWKQSMKLLWMVNMEVSVQRAVNGDRVNASSDGFPMPSAVAMGQCIALLTHRVPSTSTAVVPPKIAGPIARVPSATTSGNASSNTNMWTHFLACEEIEAESRNCDTVQAKLVAVPVTQRKFEAMLPDPTPAPATKRAKGTGLTVQEGTKLRLAAKFEVVCPPCGILASSWTLPCQQDLRALEANIRSIVAIKQIGKGQTALNDFWAAMNVSHRGLHHKTFQEHLKKTFRESEDLCMDKFYVESAVMVKVKAVTRGHTSHIGVSTTCGYTALVSDGDSRTFSALTEENVYELAPIVKEECLNHVQKGMETTLHNLVQKSDKPLSSKGRSTKALIDKRTDYYGWAL